MEIKKILCPIDFSEISANALEYAVFLASHHHAELLIFHVVEQLHEFEHYQILVLTPQELSEEMEKQAHERGQGKRYGLDCDGQPWQNRRFAHAHGQRCRKSSSKGQLSGPDCQRQKHLI
jgi:nucleotide-binding universal stress UspA family protein